MITKRKPTRYNILVSGETTKPQTLELLGSIVAFTPEQARHRGANQFADTLTTGTQPTDRVLYAVPASSMRPGTVTVRRVISVKKQVNNG